MFPFTPNSIMVKSVRRETAGSCAGSEKLTTQDDEVKTRRAGGWFVLDRNQPNYMEGNERNNRETVDRLRMQKHKPLGMAARIGGMYRGESFTSDSYRISPVRFDDSCSGLGITDSNGYCGCTQSPKHWLTKSMAVPSVSYNAHTYSENSRHLCQSWNMHCADAGTYYSAADTYIRTDVPTAISNVFWKMGLKFHPYIAGNLSNSSLSLVEFSSLWSDAEKLGCLLPDFCLNTPGSTEVLCQVAIYARVQKLLSALVDHNIIG
jgi:hypothetical protein